MTSAAQNGSGGGSGTFNFSNDRNALLGELMGNNNLDFDHGAFPLLSKDNSAVDPALLQVPMPIAMARKDMSA